MDNNELQANDQCKICKKPRQSPGPAMKSCNKCKENYHISCFSKKYGGISAVPCDVFICTLCALESDATVTEVSNKIAGEKSNVPQQEAEKKNVPENSVTSLPSLLITDIILERPVTNMNQTSTDSQKSKRLRAKSVEIDVDSAKRPRNHTENKITRQTSIDNKSQTHLTNDVTKLNKNTMSSKCNKCSKETTNIDAFECDGCAVILHATCDKVSKRDLDARKKSNRLKIICLQCCSKGETIVAENVKMILKYVEKIDLHSQMQQLTGKDIESHLTKIIKNNERIEKSITEAIKPIDSDIDQRNVSRKPSYADTVRKVVKPAVVIKPKNHKQNSKETIDEIKGQINYKEIEACGLKHVNGGGIVINCQTNTSTMKVKQMVEDKFGDKYEVRLPRVRNPRVKIFNVMDDIPENIIANELISQNEWLDESASIVVKKLIKKKYSKMGEMDVILEVDHTSFEKLLDSGSVNVGFKKCKIVHHVHITRCYKCCGYSHISTQCKNENACAKCGQNHKTSDCNSTNLECVNCCKLVNKYKLKINVNHHAFSNKCEVLQRKINQINREFSIDEKN